MKENNGRDWIRLNLSALSPSLSFFVYQDIKKMDKRRFLK